MPANRGPHPEPSRVRICAGQRSDRRKYLRPYRNGAGFGWHDINIFKIGLEWRATPTATWRLGYSYNENPIKSRDVTFNVLAPGVVQHHFTAGGEFKLSDKWSLELAGAYVPESSVKGKDMLVPTSDVEISMHQYEVTAGLKYRFDAGPEPLK